MKFGEILDKLQELADRYPEEKILQSELSILIPKDAKPEDVKVFINGGFTGPIVSVAVVTEIRADIPA